MIDAMSNVRMTACRLRLQSKIIHGSPTVGKSTLVDQLNADGVRILDTDMLHKMLSPDPNWVKIHRLESTGEIGRVKHFSEHAVMGLAAHVGSEWIAAGGLILTNMWGQGFCDGLWGLAASYRTHPSFQREPEVMTRLTESRGGEVIELKRTAKWFDDWKAAGPDYFSRMIILEEGEFLGTVLDIPQGKPPELADGCSPLLTLWRDAMLVSATKAAGPGEKRRLLVRLGSRSETWIKLTFAGLAVTGYEVYSGRPPLAYWRDNYSHDEPPVVDLYQPGMLRLSDEHGSRKWLTFWPTLNRGKHVTGVEALGHQSSRTPNLTEWFFKAAMAVPDSPAPAVEPPKSDSGV